MTIAEWLAIASADATQRGMPELVPALEGLAKATERLRAADWNDDADRETPRDRTEGRDFSPGRSSEGRDFSPGHGTEGRDFSPGHSPGRAK